MTLFNRIGEGLVLLGSKASKDCNRKSAQRSQRFLRNVSEEGKLSFCKDTPVSKPSKKKGSENGTTRTSE